MNQLHQLEKVLAFYQQQLELIKTRFKQQAGVVAEQQHQARQLQANLSAALDRSSTAEPTAVARQLAALLMEQIETKIRQNQIRLKEETTRLETQRGELRTQMSRIEALEKLVANRTNKIEHSKRQIERHLADERYLNTNFNGSMK